VRWKKENPYTANIAANANRAKRGLAGADGGFIVGFR